MRKALIGPTAGFVLCCAGLAQAEEVVIVAFGDSLTQGYGLPVEQGFVPQMQLWLDNAGADVRMINAGVSGDTTAGGLARVDWTLTPDVDGMILALGANDILRGLDPAQAKQNIDGILRAAGTADVDVLLVGMQSQGNFGAAYKTQFEALYPALAEDHDVLLAGSFFAGLMVDGTLPPMPDLLPLLQDDGLHPNAEGVAKIVEGLGPKVLELVRAIEE